MFRKWLKEGVHHLFPGRLIRKTVMLKDSTFHVKKSFRIFVITQETLGVLKYDCLCSQDRHCPLAKLTVLQFQVFIFRVSQGYRLFIISALSQNGWILSWMDRLAVTCKLWSDSKEKGKRIWKVYKFFYSRSPTSLIRYAFLTVFAQMKICYG